MTQDKNKQAAAHAAIEHIPFDAVVGVGTGSTVNYFIEALATIKGKIKNTVASSHASKALLEAAKLPVMDLNYAGEVDIYIDGADEIDPHGRMIKGGGGALTGEKIVASCAKKFICIVDEKKCVPYLGGLAGTLCCLVVSRRPWRSKRSQTFFVLASVVQSVLVPRIAGTNVPREHSHYEGS